MPSTRNSADSTDWDAMEKVYTCICAHPGKSIDHISEELSMPEEKINDALDELNKSGLVKFKFVQMSPIVRKHYPAEPAVLMTAKLKKELKKFLEKN